MNLPLELKQEIFAHVALEDPVSCAYSRQIYRATPRPLRGRFPCLAALRLVNKEFSRLGAVHIFSVRFHLQHCGRALKLIPLLLSLQSISAGPRSNSTTFQTQILPNYLPLLRRLHLHLRQAKLYPTIDITPFLYPSARLTWLSTDENTMHRIFPHIGDSNVNSARHSYISDPALLTTSGFIASALKIETLRLDYQWSRAADLTSFLALFPSLTSISLSIFQFKYNINSVGDRLKDDALLDIRRDENNALLDALGSLSKVTSLCLTGNSCGWESNFRECWNLVERYSSRLENLQVNVAVLDDELAPQTAEESVKFPSLRRVVFNCRRGFPSSLLARLHSAPVIDLQCSLSAYSDLPKLFEAFPKLRRLTLFMDADGNDRIFDARELHRIAEFVVGRGTVLKINSRKYPALQTSDFLADLPDTADAAHGALTSAATLRTINSRQVMRRQARLEGRLGDVVGIEAKTLKELEEARIAWME
ncbi:hypothetical protein P7C70_g6452, partial [Phenoliferia sp. Uapishka_3]